MHILDLFTGVFGAGMGYQQAGHTVTGVDIAPQPDHPGTFIQAEAIEFLREYGGDFDLIHASPPCQGFSAITPKHARDGYPNLITATREEILRLGKPYVIENVVPAVKKGPMRRDLMLCGEMFGLRVVRHRAFECSMFIPQPAHLKHRAGTKGVGKLHYGPIKGVEPYYVGVYGHNAGSIREWQDAMGIYWTNSRHSLAEAIPPAYTWYIGQHIG